MKWTSAGPVGVGSTGHAVGMGRNKGDWNLEATEFEKNKKITMHSVGTNKRSNNSTNSVILELTTKGTKVTMSIEYEMPYSVLGKLIDDLMVKREMEKQITKMLESLKKTLEAQLKSQTKVCRTEFCEEAKV